MDFIVIEDLEFYATSQRRAKSENAKLMMWSRRELRKKLIELCETYGLPVVETSPDYTSKKKKKKKSDARTGSPGFRAAELRRIQEENLVGTRCWIVGNVICKARKSATRNRRASINALQSCSPCWTQPIAIVGHLTNATLGARCLCRNAAGHFSLPPLGLEGLSRQT